MMTAKLVRRKSSRRRRRRASELQISYFPFHFPFLTVEKELFELLEHVVAAASFAR
jgi:hypothetical protein